MLISTELCIYPHKNINPIQVSAKNGLVYHRVHVVHHAVLAKILRLVSVHPHKLYILSSPQKSACTDFYSIHTVQMLLVDKVSDQWSWTLIRTKPNKTTLSTAKLEAFHFFPQENTNPNTVNCPPIIQNTNC